MKSECFYCSGQVSPLAANSSTRVCENVGMRMEIHRQDQEAAECPVLSPPIGRPPADFLCLASRTPAPCQQCGAEGHESRQRMLTPSASWGQSPLLQFPDVWKEQDIEICSEYVITRQ